jgi:minor histocompatibility antigen H13
MVLAALPVGFYFVTRHWALNNIFAILFTLVALKSLSLSSTKTGLFLLWALFFYDIFWVYGTDVMVTVAKNLDIPIKIVFPYLNAEGDFKTSMVGLGDLVIPGIFVSLCLKFDFDQAFAKNKSIKSFSEIELNYFNLVFVGYIYGIIETFLAMFIFEHPQPALLFLVPMCTIPVLVRAFFRGELNKFLEYDTALIVAEEKSENGPAKAEVTA